MSLESRRSSTAIATLQGQLDSHLETIERLRNGEQIPLPEGCYASFDIGRDVIDVVQMSDGRVFFTTKFEGLTSLFALGFPWEEIAGGSRIDLVGELVAGQLLSMGQLVFQQVEGETATIKTFPPEENQREIVFTGFKKEFGVPKIFSSGRFGDRSFKVVWQVLYTDHQAQYYVGDSRTGQVIGYCFVDNFVPLRDGGYAVFSFVDNAGKLHWVKPNGEFTIYDLEEGYRGNNAFLAAEGQLWFDRNNKPKHWWIVSKIESGPKVYWKRASGEGVLVSDGNRPVEWGANGWFEYLDLPDGSSETRNIFVSGASVDKSVSPFRLGEWLLFRAIKKEGKSKTIHLFGLFGDQRVNPTEIPLDFSWDLVIQEKGNCLVAGADEKGIVFSILRANGGQELSQKLHKTFRLPKGCRLSRLRFVDKHTVVCWATVGTTLNLYRVQV